jgi:hypothetical protein
MGDNTLLEPVYGQGAHADPVACEEDISAAFAAQTVADYPHSIWQITVHNSYHVGQVALLRRQMGAWPPRRSGFDW